VVYLIRQKNKDKRTKTKEQRQRTTDDGFGDVISRLSNQAAFFVSEWVDSKRSIAVNTDIFIKKEPHQKVWHGQ
jgi:hypothetical protein